MKLPSFQFYPGDWQKDPNLRRCSHAAKGVLIDLLCLMFESDERGVLATGGSPWSDEEAALSIGGDKAVTLQAISELTLKGVLNRRVDGALFSRRMVRDEQRRKLCSEAGKRGGNPILSQTLKGRLKGSSKGGLKGKSKGELTPSSSSSSSTSVEEKEVEEKSMASPCSPRGKRVTTLPDDEWLNSLEQDEVYRGIEIRSELAKAKHWCEANNRTCTRRFFVNWINRVRPLLPGQPDKMAGRAISGAANSNPINGHGSTFTLQKQLELVNQELKAIHARGFEDALSWQPANESDRQAIQKLKAQRNELKIKLGLK